MFLGLGIIQILGRKSSHVLCDVPGGMWKPLYKEIIKKGFPGGASGKEPACQCRRCKRGGSIPGSDAWVRKLPWRTAWQLTPVFLPGASHRQRSLVGYSL